MSPQENARSGNEREPLPSAEGRAALPPDGGDEFNRLIHETSPYLLLHARNPVDWHPWGPEAFRKAREQDRPVFLSVGYSTCHWCHVMARESFSDPGIAHILNEHYVPVKVDREERPDVDGYYMTATNLLTGRGGWPNSVWLTPDGRPFYAGTYFPPDAFRTVLVRLAGKWRDDRDEVEEVADSVSDAVKRASSPGGGAGERLDRSLVTAAVQGLRSSFDEKHGGFDGAPKFPPHAALRLLLYEYRRTGEKDLLEMATRTLEAMALGGIRDHLGGGFHRYSTDRRWLLPHFEKMLYDNAQLIVSCVDAYRETEDDLYRRVAEQTCEWVLREMADDGGGFYSALDSESGGVEGGYYLWSRDEIMDALGPETGKLFCRAYGVREEGNYREEATGERTGLNVLHLEKRVPDLAPELDMPPDELGSRLEAARRELLKARDLRERPRLDDKLLADWNGLMIVALARAGAHLNEPRYTKAAGGAAGFVMSAMRRDGRLLHTYRDGQASVTAFLADHACLADGLLELYRATGQQRWLDEARALADVLIAEYRDATGGGFYRTAEGRDEVIARTKDPTDGAVPSGNAVAARVLLELGRLTGDDRYTRAARETLEAFSGAMRRVPAATHGLILAAAIHLDAAAEEPPAGGEKVTTEAVGPSQPVRPGQTFRATIRIEIEEGWHVNSHRPLQGYLVPTELWLEGRPGVELEEVRYPDGRRVALGFSSEPVSVYEGRVTVEAVLRATREAGPGRRVLRFGLRVQPCTADRCLSPRTLSFELPVVVD